MGPPGDACFHIESKPNVLVRDLADEVALTRLAERPAPEELFGRVSRRRGGRVGLEQAVSDLARERPAS